MEKRFENVGWLRMDYSAAGLDQIQQQLRQARIPVDEMELGVFKKNFRFLSSSQPMRENIELMGGISDTVFWEKYLSILKTRPTRDLLKSAVVFLSLVAKR
jgi:hypothetical protein